MTETPLRILQVTTSDLSLLYLLRPQLEALRSAGHQVVLASAPGEAAERLRDEGFEFHALRHATQGWDVKADLRLAQELLQLFRRIRPDVVHSHIQKTGILARMMARAARVPRIVNTQHGMYATPEDSWRRRLPVYAMERAAAACSDVELVQNPEDLQVLRSLRLPSSRLKYLCNGVDLQRFRPPTEDERRGAREHLGLGHADVVAMGVGRLVASKGWLEYDAAAAALPGVTAALAGPLQEGKSEALDPGRLTSLRYLGVVEPSELLYWACDVLVLPSWGREGLPRAAIEAAACGRPVVGADSRGVRSVVADGVTGILHPVRDVTQLTTGLQRLVDSPSLRASMGAAGRARAERFFDEDHVVERVVAAIEGRAVREGEIP